MWLVTSAIITGFAYMAGLATRKRRRK